MLWSGPNTPVSASSPCSVHANSRCYFPRRNPENPPRRQRPHSTVDYSRHAADGNGDPTQTFVVDMSTDIHRRIVRGADSRVKASSRINEPKRAGAEKQ